MRYFVRATEVAKDTYTSYWDVGRCIWGPLDGAAVYSEEDVKESGVTTDEGNVRLGFYKQSSWVPKGRWEELPMQIRMRSVEEINEERDRRYEEDQKAEETRDERYDRLIFDGARDLADQFRNDESGMILTLNAFGVSEENLKSVLSAMCAPDYSEAMYRGKMCDEGVIEALKDCLRPLHGF